MGGIGNHNFDAQSHKQLYDKSTADPATPPPRLWTTPGTASAR